MIMLHQVDVFTTRHRPFQGTTSNEFHLSLPWMLCSCWMHRRTKSKKPRCSNSLDCLLSMPCFGTRTRGLLCCKRARLSGGEEMTNRQNDMCRSRKWQAEADLWMHRQNLEQHQQQLLHQLPLHLPTILRQSCCCLRGIY